MREPIHLISWHIDVGSTKPESFPIMSTKERITEKDKHSTDYVLIRLIPYENTNIRKTVNIRAFSYIKR